MEGRVAQQHGRRNAVAQDFEGRIDRLQVFGQGRNAGEHIEDHGAALHPVPEDTLHHVVDDLAVAQRGLPLRHDDQHKVERIGQGDELRIDARKIHADVKDDETDLPALGQAADVGQLQGNVIGAVEKAGDDDLAAEKLALRKHLVHQHARIGRFQHRDAGHHLGKAPMPADHLRAAERREL